MRGVQHTENYVKALKAGKHPEGSEKYKEGVVDALDWVLGNKKEFPILTHEMIEKAKDPKKEKKAKAEKKPAKPKVAKKPKAEKSATSFHPAPKPSQAA